MSLIHPTAIVAATAEVADDARIGPYCLVGEGVRIGAGCELASHVVVTGRTRIGQNNRIFPFASIGHEPQDLKYKGEPSEIVIGDGNTIREGVTINPGTQGGGMLTSIGNNNLLMAYAHVAHDCRIGDGVVLANCATLAGHVEVQNGAIIGGLSAIHQFVRIGSLAMVGGMSGVVKDVPPFCLTAGGYRPGLAGINIIGLKRRGVPQASVQLLKELYRLLLASAGKLAERLAQAEQLVGEDAYGRAMVDFVRDAKRGLTLPRRNGD